MPGESVCNVFSAHSTVALLKAFTRVRITGCHETKAHRTLDFLDVNDTWHCRYTIIYIISQIEHMSAISGWDWSTHDKWNNLKQNKHFTEVSATNARAQRWQFFGYNISSFSLLCVNFPLWSIFAGLPFPLFFLCHSFFFLDFLQFLLSYFLFVV